MTFLTSDKCEKILGEKNQAFCDENYIFKYKNSTIDSKNISEERNQMKYYRFKPER